MIPFLKSIAKAYMSRYADLSEMCFVFPNKRGGTFFLKYLKEVAGERGCNNGMQPFVAPEVMTITDFVGILSGRVVASRLDLLFLLYEAYRKTLGSGTIADDDLWAEDFEYFRRWGETVLSDFSEVDRYLVNPEEVFKNVKDYREITSNFLTEEQKEVMEEYFGRTDYGDPTKFWKTFDSEESELSDSKIRFLHLWRIMSALYEALGKKLESRGLTTTGGAYRQTVERLREEGRDAIPFKKVVAVGFNALSGAEKAIFRELRDAEGYDGMDAFGDFFWDATGPVLTQGLNSASKFVKSDIRHFPAPAWAMEFLRESDSDTMPRLRVVASPSKSAQVKIAGSLLAEQRRRLSADEIKDAKVAVVLPDENLLLPMLYSLPEGMGSVNLTMGYSLRLTSVASFVSLLRRMYMRMRKDSGMPAFYHKDMRLFVSHPYTRCLLGGESIGRIVRLLDRHHKSVITLQEIGVYSEEGASLLDASQLDNEPAKTIYYIDNVLKTVEQRIDNTDDAIVNSSLERDHITVYRDALRRLDDILKVYGIRMKPVAVFSMVDRLLSGEKVGFEGEPLTGLQVMGTLETRSVDFDYITIVSMNEKIMPRRLRSRSFIPDSLRYAYGMPPSNYAESIFAYYFFRMICRAKEVTLIYDARTSGEGGGLSRYILQLEHLYAKGFVEHQDWKFLLSGKEPYDPSVRKTPDVRVLMESLLVPGGSNFSASSLSAYRECEVKFYYKSILKIDTDPEPSEYIDSIMVGNILHDVMLNLYVPGESQRKFLKSPLLINKEWLAGIIENPDFVWLLVVRAVNRLHFHLAEDDLDRPLSGGPEMVGRRIMSQALSVVRHDMTVAPFKIIGCEIEEQLRVQLPSGKTVNFKFAIDRLDEVEVDGARQVRIVDYKTGHLAQDAPDEESLFDGDYSSKQLFQLFTYAWLLAKSSGGVGSDDVRVEIYHVPGLAKGEHKLPKIGKDTVVSYSTYSSGFSAGMTKMLEEIFSKDRFEAAQDDSRCNRCELKMLCRR